MPLLFNPRPYQLECFEAIRGAMKRGRKRVLVEVATGLGKAIIAAMLSRMVADKGGRTLILCNRDVLCRQAADKLTKAVSVFASVDKAEEKGSPLAEVVVGSVQTLQGKRLERWAQDHFRLVFADEVHYFASKSHRKVIEHFRDTYHVGLSATIERADGQGVGFFYEEVAYEMPLYSRTDYNNDGTVAKLVKGGISEGWLSPIIVRQIPVAVTVDEKIAHKKNISEQEEAFALAPYLEKLTLALVSEIRDRKSLVFCADCKSSEAVAELLRSQGMDARHVDSTYMKPHETQAALRWFATAPRGSVLCNASLLTTGYDQPDIDCIVPLRLIRSSPLYKQIVGRGTRAVSCDGVGIDSFETAELRRNWIQNSPKPNMLLLDLMFQNGDHDFVSPAVLVSKLKDDEATAKRKAGGFDREVDMQLLQAECEKQKLTDIEERLLKTAEQVANRAERHKRHGEIYIADIIGHRNPSHKLASPAFVRYVRGLGAKLPDATFSTYQLMRVKERILQTKERQLA